MSPRAVDTLAFQRFCLIDQARDAFHQALSQTVKSGDIVVDLGTGTGVLAHFACQAGADRVYAIEPDESFRLAAEISKHNSFQDQVVLIQDLSYRVQLPERADVLVTNTLESFGLNGGILGSVIDARKRFLKENSVIIPRWIELFVAPVELPVLYQDHIDFWAEEFHGLDFSSVRRFATNNNYPIKIDAKPFLSEPRLLTHIDLYEVKTPAICIDTSLSVTRKGVMHGFAGWFATELAENIRFSNEPGLGETDYAQSFFPLDQPVCVEEGDRLNIHIQAFNGQIWRWRVECFGRRDTRDMGEEILKSRCDQSDFKGFPLSKEDFHRMSPNYRPKLSEKGKAELSILELLDGEKTIAQIEVELLRLYPNTFYSLEDSAAFVKDAVIRCA